MPLTTLTVTATNGYVQPNGTPGNGQVVLRPVAEATGGGYIVVAADVAFSVVGGAIVAPNQIASNAQATTLQYLVYEQIQGASNPPAYVVTPTGSTLDLSTAPRGTLGQTTPIYVLASTVGQPNGPASLGSDGILAAAQRPAAGSGSVTSVAAADATIVIGGTPSVAPTVRVGTIAESQVTGLAADLAALRPTVRSAWIANGSDLTLPNTAGVWAALAGFELDLPASVGQWVEIGVHGMRSDTASAFLDIAVIKGTTLVRFLATGTSTPGFEGDPGWYTNSNSFNGQSASRGFVVTSNDLDGGNVRFVVATKAAGAGTLYSSTNYPFYWRAINLGVTN